MGSALMGFILIWYKCNNNNNYVIMIIIMIILNNRNQVRLKARKGTNGVGTDGVAADFMFV